MGVFIGIVVLLLSVALVVLLAASEWFDFDLGNTTRKAVTAAVPAAAEKGGKAKAAAGARKPAKKAVKKAVKPAARKRA